MVRGAQVALILALIMCLFATNTSSSSFSSEPPQVISKLPPYTVTQKGNSVSFEIEFQGHPLSSSGILWEVNGNKVPTSLSEDRETSSSLFLNGDSLELGDIVTATVNVFGNTSDSSESTVIVIRKCVL